MITNKIYIIIILVFFLFNSCIEKQKTISIKKTYRKINVKSLKLEEINIKYPFSTVQFSTVDMVNDSIFYLLDYRNATISKYNTDGKLLRKIFGVGSEYGGIKGVGDINVVRDSIYVFNPATKQIKIYDKNFKYLSKIYINSLDYDFLYRETLPLLLSKNKNIFYIPICKETQKLNPYGSDEYYLKNNIIGAFDFKTGNMLKTFGNYSDFFLKNKYLPNYINIYMALKDDKLIVSFEPDSLMQVYINDSLAYCFGRAGLYMNNNYTLSKSYNESEANYYTDRVTKGYYRDIYYDKDNDLLFRCYNIGTKLDSVEQILDVKARMQIYNLKNNTLIGDVEIPNGFVPVGYDGENYYAYGLSDEVKNKFFLYKFNLVYNEK